MTAPYQPSQKELNALNKKARKWGDISVGVQQVKARQAAAVQPQEAPASAAAQPALTPEQQAKAERVVIKQFQDQWGRISKRFIDITPMGTMANAEGLTTHTKTVALQNAYNTVLSQFAQISGDEYLGSYILSMGLSSTQQRQATLAALTRIISGGPLAEAPQPGISARGAAMPQGQVSPEEFGQLVMDPSKFKDLNYFQQQDFIAKAQNVVSEYGKRGQQADAITRAIAAVATGDMTTVLSDSEIEDLHKSVAKMRDSGLDLATPGTEETTWTFDADWAKAHPAKAAAEAYYIQQQFPNVTIKYGSDGIVSEFFNALAKPIDVVATPFSTLIGQSERAVRHVFDHGDVGELQAELKRQQENLLHAEYSDRGAIMNTIDNLRDRIGVITGESLQGEATRSMMDRSLNSATANLGFARNMVEGTGLLPGDEGYELAVGAAMVAGGVAFDPLTWATGAVAGFRAARTIPRAVGEAAGAMEGGYAVRGLIGRFVYNRLSMTPEQFLEHSRTPATLAKVAATVDRPSYATFLQSFIDDSFVRSQLLAAGDNEDSISSILHLATSGYHEGKDSTVLINRAEELATRLNEFERLEARASEVRAATKGESELASIERDIAAMDEAGMAVGPEYDSLVARARELQPAAPKGMDIVDQAVGAQRPTALREGYTRAYHEGDLADLASYREKGILAFPDKADVMKRKYVSAQNEVRGAERLAEGAIPKDRIYIEFQVPSETERGQATMGSATKQFQVESIPPEDFIQIHNTNETAGKALLTDGQFQPEFEALRADGTLESYGRNVFGGDGKYFYVNETGDVEGVRTVAEDGRATTLVADGAEGKGIEEALLQAHWDDLGVADNPEALAEAIRTAGDHTEVARMAARDRLNGLRGMGTRLDELRSTALQDKEELAHVRSLMKGKTDSVLPINFSDLKALEKSGNRWLKELGKTADGLAGFPRGPVSAAYDGNAKAIMRGINRILGKPFEMPGTEGAQAAKGYLMRALWMPGVPLPEGATVDAVERSREAFAAVGKVLDAPEDVIAKWLGQWDDLVLLGDRDASYRWLTGYWDSILTNSRKLSPEGKVALSKLWKTPFDSYGSDFVRTNKAGEFVTNSPLGYKTITDPATGQPMKAPQAIFSADSLSHGVFLPPLQDIMKALHPTASKYLAGEKMTRVTGFWKTAVLLGKMPFALPARIVGELTMARMTAYNLAGLSPFGVLDYIRSIAGKGKYAEFADKGEAFALGNIIEDFEDEGRIFNQLSGMGMLTSVDGKNFYRALSGRLKALSSSPEMRYILRTRSPEEFVAMLHDPMAPQALKSVAAHWATFDGGLDANAARIWTYIQKDMVGTGDFSTEMRRLLAGGRLTDGTEAGTIALANRIENEVKNGRYFFGAGGGTVHAKYGQGLTMVGEQAARSFPTKARDWLFSSFYQTPEEVLGRIPAWRQLSTKYYKELIAQKYPEELAHAIASTSAQREVADLFFKIGAHTSGEFMVRNLSPFFPAWREVTDTWLIKLPERIGGGGRLGRVVGYPYLLNRARLLMDVAKQVGIVETGPDGRLRIPTGPVGQVMSALIPGDTEYEFNLSFSSLFGILPAPSLDGGTWAEQVASMAPGLGGFWGLGTQMASRRILDRTHPGWQQDVSDLLSPYGVGDVGGNFSRLYTAIALEVGADPIPPWEKFMDPGYRESLVHSSIDDALRTLVATGDPRYQPPSWNDIPLKPDGSVDPKDAKEFVHQYNEWRARTLEDAEHLAGAEYLQKALGGMLFPISGALTPPEQDSITAVWAMLNGEGLPQEVRDALAPAMLDSFRTAYPFADWYTVGKTTAMSKRGARDPNLSDDMEAVFQAGLRRVQNPQDYSIWAMGMGSYSQYRAERNAIYAEFDNNPVDYLLNGSDARERLQALDGRWQAFLEASDVWAKQQHSTSFKTMLAQAEYDWYGKDQHPFDITANAAKRLAATLPLVQSAVEEGTYDDIRGQLFRSIDENRKAAEGAGVTMWASIDKYYTKVADPYYQKLDRMYDEANKYASQDPRRAATFQAIREFTAAQKPRTIDGVKFPTPEVTAFSTKDPEEQRQSVTKWLSWGHAEWLTPFQQEVSGLSAPGKAKKVDALTQFVTQAESRFDAVWSYNESGYDQARKALTRIEEAKANELGLGDVFHLWQAPTYVKLDNALRGDTGRGWDLAKSAADSAWASITKAGYSSGGTTSPNALPTQRWLFSRLNQLYASNGDFKTIIDNAGVALADDPERPLSRQDIFWRLFLDGYGSAPAGLL